MIGIGAGPRRDGQTPVYHDLLGAVVGRQRARAARAWLYLGAVVAGSAGLLAAWSVAAWAQTPSAPEIGGVHAGDGALTVVWSAPDETGIVSYDLRYIETSDDENDDANWSVIQGVGNSEGLVHVLTGLANGTGYDVQVRAVTTTDGSWSATTSATPAEPGDALASALTVTAGVPVGASFDPAGDVDYFKLVLAAASEVLIYTSGDLDTVGVLVDANGRAIKSSDDDEHSPHGVGHFFIWDYRAAGTYYVKVTSYADAVGDYTLHTAAAADTPHRPLSDSLQVGIGSVTEAVLGAAPGDGADAYKLVLEETTDIVFHTTGRLDTWGELRDSDGNYIVSSYDFAGQDHFLIRRKLNAGTYYLVVTTSRQRTPPYWAAGPYRLHVREVVGPGATIAAAPLISHGQGTGGSIDSSGDIDYFQVNPSEDTDTFIGVDSGAFEVEAQLVDGNGDNLDKRSYTYADNAGSSWGWILIDTLETEAHYIKVSAASGTGDYSVLVLPRNRYEALVQRCEKLGARDAPIADPLYGCQWHLNNSGQLGGVSGEDINVEEVWSEGILGDGVNVAVSDDGIHDFHPDLAGNLDRTLSHDYGGPSKVEDSHGIHMAGLIAGRDNDVGIRGVAPRATVYGYDLDDLSDENLVAALTRNMATTAVSALGYGPLAGAAATRAPGEWETAMDTGVSEGYGGKGVLYVTGAGNDAGHGGNSNLSEYSNYYGVTAVCAVDDRGLRAGYSERGANLWVCAPSSPDADNSNILTTAAFGAYNESFGGTSAATAIASGVAALVRGAYSGLSWRDVKLILAGSARKNDAADSGWQTGAQKHDAVAERYEFNHAYGFGVVDAKAAVDLAGDWQSLPAMSEVVSEPVTKPMPIPVGGTQVSSSFKLPAGTAVDFVEFVEVQAILAAPAFRQLQLELVSPSGAVSELSVPSACRGHDGGAADCTVNGAFRFGTARHLGEDPAGMWTLRAAHRRSGGSANQVTAWNISVYGHKSKPGAPVIQSLVPAQGSLTVEWTAPDETGTSDLSSYDVRFIRSDAADKDSDSAWTVVDDAWTAGPLRYTITSLVGSVRYDAQVRGVNSRGNGDWSDTTTASSHNTQPVFEEGSSAARTLPENTAADRPVGEPLTALDAEDDELTYALDGPDAGKFTIDAGSGQISTMASLDHEATPDLSVTVTVSDGKDHLGDADPSVDASIDVTVSISDVDEPPELVGDAAPSYAEGGTGPVTDFTATDPEDRPVAWTLAGADAGVFNLSDGRLEFAATPDYENPRDSGRNNVYEVTVRIADGSNTAEMAVAVTVTNVDEQGSLSLTSLHPQEGIQLTASLEDPDGAVSGQVWEWEVSSSGSWTAVPGATSASYTPVNADVGKSLRVTVTYRDGHGNGKSATVTAQSSVQPERQSNTAPQFPPEETGERTVPENTDPESPVGEPVSAVDNEESDLTYSLSGSEHFGINPANGQLLTRGALDFETRRTYTFTVIAEDSSQARASLQVAVTVEDRDEDGALALSPPVPRVGTPVTATLTDPDGAMDATWQWHRSPSGLGNWATIAGAGSRTYTPAAADQDRYLRATATYRDRHSSGIQISAVTQIAVQARQERVGGGPGPGGPGPGIVGPPQTVEEPPVRPAAPAPFADVGVDSVHAPNIAALYAAGITTGCDAEPLRYCPSQPVTRAEMASFLSRALDLDTPAAPAPFADVGVDSVHAPNIAALYAAGITTGCDAEPLRYCPSQPVTRAEMASFLSRALDLDTPAA